MPHIMFMHSLGDTIEQASLAQKLHDGFAALETINKEALKTYFLPTSAACVGTEQQPEDMIHIILRMKPGRTPEIKAMLTKWLHDTTRTHTNALGLATTISVEPLEMDYDFYVSSHA